jgi:hypothetical protein
MYVVIKQALLYTTTNSSKGHIFFTQDHFTSLPFMKDILFLLIK